MERAKEASLDHPLRRPAAEPEARDPAPRARTDLSPRAAALRGLVQAMRQGNPSAPAEAGDIHPDADLQASAEPDLGPIDAPDSTLRPAPTRAAEQQQLTSEALLAPPNENGLVQARLADRQGPVQLGKHRNRTSRPRAAKIVKGIERPARNDEMVRIRIKTERDREFLRTQKIRQAEKMRAFRQALGRQINDYAKYPEGSYGHGRWLYLTGRLKELGGSKPRERDLISFDFASVEIDHSPSDSSQRGGDRVDDEASRYRVAVPLPRGWHRRHKTTHGPGANQTFIDAQNALVSSNNYAEALKNHLMETFSDGAIGTMGKGQVQAVINHTKAAIMYAASPIPEKIHHHHVKGDCAITNAQRDVIINDMKARIATLNSGKFQYNNLTWPAP